MDTKRDRTVLMRPFTHAAVTIRLVVGFAALVTAACTDSSGPGWLRYRTFELPPPSTSLDPDSVRSNTTLYICNGWLSTPPTTSPIVVDVFFSGTGTGPSLAQLRSLSDAGAEVGYRFPFQAARVRVATAQIPVLYAMTGGTVYTVSDVRRYDWLIGAIYSREPTMADETAIAELGGRITERHAPAKMLFAAMPVSSLSRLRSLDGVKAAEATRQYFCNEVSRSPNLP